MKQTSATQIIYRILDSYQPSSMRIFNFGSRPENNKKTEQLKARLMTIAEAVEKKGITPLQESILLNISLNDSRFQPAADSQGKYLRILQSALKKLNEIYSKKLSLTEDDSWSYIEFGNEYLRITRTYHGDLKKGEEKGFAVFFKQKQGKIPSIVADFFSTEQKIKEHLHQVAAGKALLDTSPLFQLLLDVYCLSFPQPNMITNISEHLASEPLPRIAGWRPRRSQRQWRHDDWILDSYPELTKNSEEIMLIDKITPAHKPNLISIKSIVEKGQDKKTESKIPATPTYTILVGSDALVNHNFRCFKNAIIQMASQGNCQESTDRSLAHLSDYCQDKTQGPASAMSAVDATLLRRVFLKDCDLMSAWLYQYDPDQKHFDYHTGYLTPKAGQVQECLKLLEEHGAEILLNVQQVRIDNAGKADDHWMTQVPCFAFALGGYDTFRKQRPKEDKEVMPALCGKLLELQYQAIAYLAVLKSQALNQRIPLLLTPVGGGVFGNSLRAVNKAISSIQSIIDGAKVDVVLSIFNPSEVKQYVDEIPFLASAVVLSHQEIAKITVGTGLLDKYRSSSSTRVTLEDKRLSNSSQPEKIPEPTLADKIQPRPEPTQDSSEQKQISIGTEFKEAPDTQAPVALSQPGSEVEDFKHYVQLVNAELIAIIEKYKIDAEAGGGTMQKEQAADQLIVLFKTHNYDTLTGRETINHNIKQLKQTSSMPMWDKTSKFKEMLTALERQLALRTQEMPIVSQTTPSA